MKKHQISPIGGTLYKICGLYTLKLVVKHKKGQVTLPGLRILKRHEHYIQWLILAWIPDLRDKEAIKDILVRKLATTEDGL